MMMMTFICSCSMGVAPPASPPIITQVAGINDKLVRQEALLETVLVRMTPSELTDSVQDLAFMT
jgi:hypothetical protein